jgi:hypothetical protein
MQALKRKLKKLKKKLKGENMDINKRYKTGELAPDAPKAPIEPMAIDPNSKVTQGATSGDGNDAKGKSKSKVDPAIFRMAEERDY